MNLNRWQGIGNLTNNPEIRKLPTGAMVANFSIATNKKWKDKDGVLQEKVNYHSIEVWGKMAEVVQSYCTKGKKIYIEGELDSNEWEKEGVKHRGYKIRCQNLILLGSKSDSQQNTSQSTQRNVDPNTGEIKDDFDTMFE